MTLPKYAHEEHRVLVLYEVDFVIYIRSEVTMCILLKHPRWVDEQRNLFFFKKNHSVNPIYLRKKCIQEENFNSHSERNSSRHKSILQTVYKAKG